VLSEKRELYAVLSTHPSALSTIINGGAPMAGTPKVTLDEIPELYQDLERQYLVSLWEIAPQLLPREPQPQAVPYLWRWADIAPLAHRSAKLVPIERSGERRVIAFMNPGLGGK
jgi:gentisate 1,2-dioxygenase